MSVVGEGTRRLVHHYMSVYHSISLLSSPAKFLIISTVPWGFCKLSQMNHSFMNTNIQMCFITFCCIIPSGNQNTCCIIPLGNQNTYPSPQKNTLPSIHPTTTPSSHRRLCEPTHCPCHHFFSSHLVEIGTLVKHLHIHLLLQLPP